MEHGLISRIDHDTQFGLVNGKEKNSWVAGPVQRGLTDDHTDVRPSGTFNTLDEIVHKLRQIERQTGLERTLAIGELVLERFYAGRTEVYHDRSSRKVSSLRRLAERADCPMSRSKLNDAVGVYLLVRGMPHLREFRHVASSHIREALRLPASMRETLLQEAEIEKWSVREIRRRADVQRREQGERRGRPACSDDERLIAGVRSGVRVVGRAIEDLETAAFLPESARIQALGLGSELSSLGGVLVDLANGTRQSPLHCPVAEPDAAD